MKDKIPRTYGFFTRVWSDDNLEEYQDVSVHCGHCDFEICVDSSIKNGKARCRSCDGVFNFTLMEERD